jgi:glycosyltransferase involved in cell wall biosynthesis
MTGDSRHPGSRRVLWVSPTLDPDFGGPTTTTVNGLIAETRAGVDCRLVTTRAPSGDSDPAAGQMRRLQAEGVPVMRFRRSRLPRAAAWGLSARMLLWMVRNLRRVDVVHFQYVWCAPTVFGCLIASACGVPVVLTPHESLTGYDIQVASRNRFMSAFKKLLRRLVLRRVDRLVLMSELELRQTDAGPAQAVLIRHALADRPLRPRERPAPRPSEGMRIAFLGRNVPKKGIERLIRALADERAAAWRLQVAGPVGDARHARLLAELSRELGVSDRVSWLGFVESTSELFAASDVLAMPSDYEGFGMSAAEAMAAGLPVAVPRLSGIAELVAEFDAGRLIESPGEQGLVRALADLDANREDWGRLGDNGIRAVNARLSFAAFSEATGELYRSLPDGGPGEDRASSAIDRTRATGR